MGMEWHAEAIQLYDSGMSYPKVAKHFGKSGSTAFSAINNSLTAHGLPPRTKVKRTKEETAQLRRDRWATMGVEQREHVRELTRLRNQEYRRRKAEQ